MFEQHRHMLCFSSVSFFFNIAAHLFSVLAYTKLKHWYLDERISPELYVNILSHSKWEISILGEMLVLIPLELK